MVVVVATGNQVASEAAGILTLVPKEDLARGRVVAKVADGTVRDGGAAWKEGLIHSTLWVS